MLTKARKKEHIDEFRALLSGSGSLAFADFTGVDTEAVKRLKRALKGAGGQYRVTKKRLLRIALKEAGIPFDPEQFGAQLGTVFAEGDIFSVAGVIYKFAKDLAKEKKQFQVLGAYDLRARAFMTGEEFVALAKLPSRETLLAQFVGMVAAPLRSFLFILKELSNRTPAAAVAAADGAQTVEQNN